MTTSASKDFAVTRDDIITMALRKIGVNDAQDSVPAVELAAAALTLNTLVKEWTGEGLALWLRKTCVLFLKQGQQRYTSGSSDSLVFQSGIYYGTLTADTASGATTLTVTEWTTYDGTVVTTNLGAGIALVRLTSGGMSRTAMSASAATTATVTATTGAASAGARVYLYATASAVTRPVRVLSANRVDTSGNTAEVTLIGRSDYDNLSRKDADGDPVQLHFDPQLGSVQFLVWPVGNSVTVDQIVMTLEFYPDDFDAAANNPEFPIEWANALVWNLAMELSFEYGTDVRTRTQIAQIALFKKTTLFDTADRENTAVTFAVASR